MTIHNASKTYMTEVCKVNCNGTSCTAWGFSKSESEIIFVISHPLWQKKQGWDSNTERNAYFLNCQNRNKRRLLNVCHISSTVSIKDIIHHIYCQCPLKAQALLTWVQMTRDHGRVLHGEHLYSYHSVMSCISTARSSTKHNEMSSCHNIILLCYELSDLLAGGRSVCGIAVVNGWTGTSCGLLTACTLSKNYARKKYRPNKSSVLFKLWALLSL